MTSAIEQEEQDKLLTSKTGGNNRSSDHNIDNLSNETSSEEF
jgi:hypothetical protein